MGWAALAIYFAISVLTVALADPELVVERSALRTGIRIGDMVLASLSFLFFLPTSLLVAGLDAGRFQWSPALPPTVELSALVVFALGNALGSWAAVTNRFFSTFVRIQKDRGRHVVVGGPYRWVRHPGYLGQIMAAMALPLALGSLWALIPALTGALGFAMRTALEDSTLQRELEGYVDYTNKVPYRLIPGVW
jgi:protein-S-isoprenylcysteine O-methyltransferase Ste14